MTAMSSHPDLEVASTVADEAAALALRYFEAGTTVTSKADGSPVTEADLAVERLLRRRLAELRRDDAVLGEEGGQVGDSERRWILDPVDGTAFFGRGDPNWRVHVALEVRGLTELAVVVAPALGVRWWGVRGGGAFETSWPGGAEAPAGAARRLAVSGTSSVDEAVVEALASPERGGIPAGMRPTSSPLPLVGLVRGEIDGFLVERYSVWDHAPWVLLVQEAGGRFTDSTGGSAGDRGGGLYSNAALHAELTAALGYPAAC